MIYPEKMNIFICDSIEESSTTYKAILQNIEEDIHLRMINVIRNRAFAGIDESKVKTVVRFGCVTPDTPTFMTESLVKEAIPVLFFGPDDRNQYEMLLVKKHKIDSKELDKMIYNVSHQYEISGAIKWVHTYYYHICQNQMRIREEKLREFQETRKKLASMAVTEMSNPEE